MNKEQPEKNQKSIDADELLNTVLAGKNEQFKKRIRDYIGKSGLSPNDPLFLIIVATGKLELLLEDAPNILKLLFDSWNKDISSNLQAIELLTVERQKLAIAKAASELIKKSQPRLINNFYTTILPAILLFTAVFSFGYLTGTTIPYFLEDWFKLPQRLTTGEVQLLRWAQSDEGKLARNLIKWNTGYLDNKECLKDSQNLKLVLTHGTRKGVYGFCILWTVPPDKRKFSP